MHTLSFMLPCGRWLLCIPEGLSCSRNEHWGRSHYQVPGKPRNFGISSLDHGSSTAESFRPSIVRNTQSETEATAGVQRGVCILATGLDRSPWVSRGICIQPNAPYSAHT